MGRARVGRRRKRAFIGSVLELEKRRTPSGGMVSALLENPIGYVALHPNTPIMPFATPSNKASFIDLTVKIIHGQSVVIGLQNFIGPYATLNGHSGAIKIGNLSNILDNSSLVADPSGQDPHAVIRIGDEVVVGFGARIEGPSTIGGYFAAGQPTAIGAGALIDGATVQPGAMVSPRARVGPGVTIPTGYKVLPGKNVTTQAEADNPRLGLVAPMTASDVSTITQTLAENAALAAGYSQLYQGNPATGVNIGANPAIGGIYFGNEAAILGANREPGPNRDPYETSKSAPEFLTPRQGLIGTILSTFPGRLTGKVEIGMRAWRAAHRLGRANAIRADEGQPISIGSIAHTGSHVTINSPLGGTLAIGKNFRAGAGAVVLSGPNVNAVLGNDVTIGDGAVVDRASLGSGSTVGAGAYLYKSTFPADTVIPPGAIYLNGKYAGQVGW